MRVSIRSAVNRRRLLTTSASAATLTAVSTIARPYLSFAADRPAITHGVQSGDVSVDSAVVWARADRPSRMQVEISTTDSFNVIHQGGYVDARSIADRRITACRRTVECLLLAQSRHRRTPLSCPLCLTIIAMRLLA